MDQVYASLPVNASDSIRLLKIHPALEAEGIKITLLSASLNDLTLEYEALSYAWGSEKDPLEITCDGVPLYVTRNLHSALRRLRHQSEVRTFWIDAICINQKDYDERASQVRIMRQIYQQANLVWADLGEEVENQQDLFNLLFALDKVLNERENDTLPLDPADFEQLGLPEVHASGWVAWTKLLSRDYFMRLWVVQEFAVAAEIYFLLGVTSFPWWNLYHIISRMQKHGIAEDQRPIAGDSSVALTAVQGKNRIRNLHFQRDRFMANDPRRMEDLLWESRFCQAKEPKDKVFAILGLVTDVDVNQPGLEIEYSDAESVEELYTRVARSLLKSNPDNLPSLLYEAGSALHPRIPGLASWIPDWSVPRAGSPLGGLSNVVNYHAADQRPQKFSLATDSPILNIEGAVFDRIRTTISEFRPDTDPSHQRDDVYYGTEVVKWLRSAIELKSSITNPTYSQVSHTSKTIEDAFWRTLIGSKTHLDTPAPESYADEYEALLVRQRFAQEAIDRAQQTGENVLVQDDTGAWLQAERESRLYRHALQNMMYTKKYALTEKGYMGMLPSGSQAGDQICLFSGTAVPYVVRRETNKSWTLIGECYIHGVMNGELLQGGQVVWEMMDVA